MRRRKPPPPDVETNTAEVTERSTELIPLAEVEDMVRNAVDHALAAEYLPSLLRPDPPRNGLENPALLGFPPTLPVELALGDQPRNVILAAYEITPESWDRLRANPVFVNALKAAVEMMQRDGMSFRVKARLQSEALLETSWKMIHNQNTPSAVRADLIKHTHRVAGLEPKETPQTIVPLQINIDLR